MELTRALLRSNERARRCYTLPRSVELDPSIRKPLAVHVRLPFLLALYSQYPDDDCHIPVHLHIAFLGHSLRRLVVRRFNARQEFAFGGNASVDINGYKSVRENHVQGLRVFSLQGAIPGIFKRKNQSAIIARALLLRPCRG